MTHDEALREIGVAPGSSPEEIRRACSRKTRTWNPAADPDGLRRLREAHDLLLAAPPPQPTPLPPPGTYSAAPPSRPAAPLYEAREPDDSWISSEPVPEESSGRRWLAIFRGGLVLFLALWLWLSRFQKANEPVVEPQPKWANNQPAGGQVDPFRSDYVQYGSAKEALAGYCAVRTAPRKKEYCDTAEKILQATEQHKCSDAKFLMGRLDPSIQPAGSFLSKLDEEIARCWKFWNP